MYQTYSISLTAKNHTVVNKQKLLDLNFGANESQLIVLTVSVGVSSCSSQRYLPSVSSRQRFDLVPKCTIPLLRFQPEYP